MWLLGDDTWMEPMLLDGDFSEDRKYILWPCGVAPAWFRTTASRCLRRCDYATTLARPKSRLDERVLRNAGVAQDRYPYRCYHRIIFLDWPF